MEEKENLVEQECKNCGGVLRFDPESCSLVCDNCGYSEDLTEKPENSEISFEGVDLDSLNEAVSEGSSETLPIYICKSCGAEVITPPEQAALTCPYCGNNIVLTDKVSGRLRPNGIVPFRIAVKDLPQIMRKYCKGKKLLPKDFFSDGRMSRITGVYMPFWVFDGHVSGQISYNGTNSHTVQDGDYEVTKTDYYKVLRDVSADFKDLPVNASRKTDDALMDSLEPFDLSEERPFDMRLLAGFTADRFDLECEDIKPRAVACMKQTVERLSSAEASGDYDSVTRTGGRLTADIRARYLLLPVYLFEIAHKAKTFVYAVNGQTGKVTGKLPKDGKTALMYFLKRAGIVACILSIGFIISYFVRR